MPFATADDVRELIPRESLSTEETAMVERRIARAERIIRKRIPDLDDRILDGTLSDQDVGDVVIEAVLRVVRNPDGYTQEVDGNYSYILSSENNGKLFITDEEWEELGVKARSGIAWMVPTIRVPKV